MNEILVIPGGETIERYLESTKELPEDVSLFQANLTKIQYMVTEIELFLTNDSWSIIDALQLWLFENRYGIEGDRSSLKRISVKIDGKAFKFSRHKLDVIAELLPKIPIDRYPVNRSIIYLDIVFVGMDKESHKLEEIGEHIVFPFTYMSEKSIKETITAFFVRYYNVPLLDRFN